MSRLGDLLELMFTAHARVASVRAVLREWSDMELWQESARRWEALGTLGSRTVLRGADSADAKYTEEHLYRVWHAPGSRRWRVESDRAHASLTVLDGARWWGAGSQDAPLTNVRPDGSIADNVGGSLPSRFLELIFDPASLLASTTIEAGGESQLAGRPTVEAVARWRQGIDLVSVDWPYADELRLMVDWEYGVLLRLEFLLDGEPFIRWQVEEIAFDQVLPDSTFGALPGARCLDVDTLAPSAELLKLMEEFRAMGEQEAGDE